MMIANTEGTSEDFMNRTTAARSAIRSEASGALFFVAHLFALVLVAVPGPSFAQSGPPVAAYGFDEGTGTTLTDASGNGFHGTLTNGPVWTTGQRGSALQFNASDDGNDDNDPRVVLGRAINIPDLPLTISAWVNPTDYTDWRAIISKRDSPVASDLRLDVGLEPGSGRVYVFNGAVNSFFYAPPVSIWTHLAVVADASGTHLYVNGALQETIGAITLGTSRSANAVIGGSGEGPGGDNDPFKGMIDDLRIYNRALNATEIQADMNTGVVPVAPETIPPTAPTGLTATAVNGIQIDLDWTASTDNVWVAGYRVERCQGAGCTDFVQVAVSASNSIGNAGLTSSTSYSYRVRAVDPVGNLSAYSNVASATTSSLVPSGPVAAYGFNEGSGSTVADSSGNGNTGAVGSGVSWSAQGKFGNALSFNGTDLVTIADAPALDLTSAMTLEAWVFPTVALANWNTVLLKEQPNTLVYALYAFNDKPNVFFNPAATAGAEHGVTGSNVLPLNTWSHLAGTYDGSTLRLYVDGELVASQEHAGSIISSTGALRIGGNTVWLDEFFKGQIDEVRIYNRALNAAEIQADMNTAVVPLAPETIPPSAPTGLTATVVSGAQIDLTWTASADNVGVSGYRVERCQGAGCTDFVQVGTPTATTFGNAGLRPSTTYSYRVRAVDPAGNLSAYSNVASASTSSVAPPGPVAAYGFDEGTGTTLTDASGNGFHGTLTNGPVWTAGQHGSALQFDASDDGNDDNDPRVALGRTINIPDLPLTLSAWVHPTDYTDWRAIVSKRDSPLASDLRLDIGLEQGSGRVYFFDGAVHTFYFAPPVNSWTHLAVVADAAGTRLYVNGELRQTIHAIALGTNASANTVIGGTGEGPGGENDPFKGAIDDLRIYNRALNVAEIQADMNAAASSTPELFLTAPATTLVVGNSTTVTVTSTDPAPSGGLAVALGATGAGGASFPSAVSIPAGGTSASFALTASAAGDVTLTATAPGRLPGAIAFTILPALQIAAISPSSGPVGTAVTLTGNGFSLVPANNQTVFRGINDTTVAATVQSASATQMVVTVPPLAETGPIAVTNSLGTAQSSPFTVTREQDFQVVVTPPSVTVFQGASNSAQIQLSSTGTQAFTGIASLSALALPAGVTATFNPATLSAFQTGTLTLAANGTTAPGSYGVIVRADWTESGQLFSRTSGITLIVQSAAGVTGVKGRFVTPAGEGIAGVIVRADIDPATQPQTVTDAAGNFQLAGLPAGQFVLRFDATPANPLYPIWPYLVTLPAGQISVIPDWTINPPPTEDKFVPIANAAQEQVVTDPRFPGLEVRLPAGTTITGYDGVVKTRIAVEKVELTKLPVTAPPTPTGAAYQMYFGTPMGGIPSTPIPVTLPNDVAAEPGDSVDVFFFDGSPMGGTGDWKVAGQGIVSADGKSVRMPDGTGIPRFCGVCGLMCLGKQAPAPDIAPVNRKCDGNPVDLANGQEMPTTGGLRCGGLTPISTGMTYNPVDAFNNIGGTVGSIGFGWVLDYDVAFLPFVGPQKRLVLPGNNRVNFTDDGNGNYKPFDDPRFDGAVITATNLGANEWQLKFRDGRLWRFKPFAGIPTFIRNGPPTFVTEMVDAQGNELPITRLVNGRIASIGTPDRGVTMSYGANGFVSEIRDTANRAVSFTYTPSNRIATKTDPDGRITNYTYVDDSEFAIPAACPAQPSFGERLKTITYPGRPVPTENFYGPGRRVLRQTGYDGREYRFAYKVTGACVTNISSPNTVCIGVACPDVDSWDNFQAGWRIHGGTVVATAVTQPNGQTKSSEFNARGVSTADTDALGQKASTKVDAANRITERSDALGRTWKFQYDALGNLTQTTDPLGRITNTTYDATFNKPTSVTRFDEAAQPQTWSFTYDSLKGTLLTATNPLNQTTSFAYTARGELEQVTDALTHATRFEYNAAGDLTTITDALANVTRFGVDEVGRRVATTDPLGFATRSAYDGADRVTGVTDARGGQTAMAYDPAGRLESVTNARNVITESYLYDSGDRMTVRADATNRQRLYQYDAVGRLASITDRKGLVTTYDYDGENRVVAVTRAEGITRFTYDAVGRVSQITDPSGTIGYAYDTVDRLVEETQVSGGVRTVVSYAYDALDRRISRSVEGVANETTAYGYDRANRLTSIQYRGQTTAFEYDAAGRLTRKTLPNGLRQDLAYDAANRPLSIAYTRPDGSAIETIAYTYDANGRRVTETKSGAALAETPFSAQYDAADRMTGITLSATGQSFALAYDENGNLASRTETANPANLTTYQWDSRNRLIAIQGPGMSASFAYDALGRRTGKTVNGQSVSYVYDGLQAVGEVGPAGATGLLTGLGLDEVIARYTSTAARTYLTDALNTVLAQTREDQTIQNFYAYSAYGEASTLGDDEGNAIQYTARENDQTGLYFYRARYYDPILKRFISEDPIGLLAGTNFYAYVGGNPITRLDPLGLDWQFTIGVSGSLGGPIIGGVSGFLGGGVSIGFTTSGQIIIQNQATFSVGGGAFGGVGFQGGVSRSDCPTSPGISYQDSLQADFNYGVGPAVGGSVQYGGDGNIGVQYGLTGGVGFGAQASAGATRTTTIATPALFGSSTCGCP